MLVFVITLATLLLIIAIMAVGVMFGRKPIAGSCGGVAAALGEKDYICEVCGDDPNKCEQSPVVSSSNEQGALSYDATTR